MSTGRCSGPGIPGGRVAGTDDDGIGFRVKTGALPGRSAAVAPGFYLTGRAVGVIRPAGSPGVAGGGAFLAVEAPVMAFNEGTHPDFLTGVRIPGEEFAHHTELGTASRVWEMMSGGVSSMPIIKQSDVVPRMRIITPW